MLLAGKFQNIFFCFVHLTRFFVQLNKAREVEQIRGDRTDWQSVSKVDTHIHLAAGFTATHLFSFIRDKLHNTPDDVVSRTKEGKDLTLLDIFVAARIDPTKLALNMLDVQADFDGQCFCSNLCVVVD